MPPGAIKSKHLQIQYYTDASRYDSWESRLDIIKQII